jgi:hypothetical protein
MPKTERSLSERFWTKVRKTDNCWIWTGAKKQRGYGVIGIGSRNPWYIALAHRVAYELLVGPIPQGKNVLHHCDNPTCVNPEHLFLGDQFDNAHDSMTKGRRVVKFTLKQVREIREKYQDGKTMQVIASEYGTSQGYVSEIVNRLSWRKIEDASYSA